MSLNPYETLGVDRSADAEVVRRAYRKRAKKVHPDGGGSAAAFNDLRWSMIVLTDPVRREKFDRTGDIDADSIDNTLTQAISKVVEFVIAAAAAGGDPCRMDLIAEARKYFRHQKLEFENQAKVLAKASQAFAKVEQRFGGKGRAELVKRALSSHAEAMLRPVAMLNEQAGVCAAALSILEECTFKFDVPAPTMTFYNMAAT